VNEEPNLRHRGTRIGAVGSALHSTDTNLTAVVDGLKGILADELWREFVTARGELVRHRRFVDFVTMPMLSGLGVSVDLVRRIVADDVDALSALDEALQGQHGGDRRSGDAHTNDANSNVGRPTGTTREQALRRLRREAESGNDDAAALRDDVLAGRLSAHAAMVSAGFRPKTVTVPVGKPESVAAALRKHMTPDDLRTLRDLLGGVRRRL
jgi:hypothetical protein